MLNQHKGFLLIFSTAVISGAAIFINRFSVKVINPYVFTGLKNVITVFFLLSIILAIGEYRQFKALTKKQWLKLIIIGFVGGSLPFLLFFKGLSITTGPEAGFIHKAMFVPVIIMAWLILKEKLNKSLIVGAGLLLLGNVLLLKLTTNIILDKGDLLIAIAVLLWSCEQIISKKAIASISPRIVALGRLGFGFGFIFIFWMFTGELQLINTLSVQQISWTVLTAVFLLAYVLTWYTGLKYIKLSQAICILSLGAPITALLTLFQGAPISYWQIIGLVAIISGVTLCFAPKKLIYVRT